MHSFLFHYGVKEDETGYSVQRLDSYPATSSRRVSWKGWFLKIQFYQVSYVILIDRKYSMFA